MLAEQNSQGMTLLALQQRSRLYPNSFYTNDPVAYYLRM